MKEKYVVDIIKDEEVSCGQRIFIPVIVQDITEEYQIEVRYESNTLILGKLDSVILDLSGKITAHNMEQVLHAFSSFSVYQEVLLEGSTAVVPCLTVPWQQLLQKGPVTFRIIN